jgi:hypothetical protein
MLPAPAKVKSLRKKIGEKHSLTFPKSIAGTTCLAVGLIGY